MAISLHRFVRKIREINHRYSEPHIEMSAGVKMSLISNSHYGINRLK